MVNVNLNNEAISLQLEHGESVEVPEGEVWRVNFCFASGFSDSATVDINDHCILLARGGSSGGGMRHDATASADGSYIVVGGDFIRYGHESPDYSHPEGGVHALHVSGFVVKND